MYKTLSFYVFWLITPISESISGLLICPTFFFFLNDFLLLWPWFLGGSRTYFYEKFPVVIYWRLSRILVSVGGKCVCFCHLFWGGSATNTKPNKIKYSSWIFWNLTPTVKKWKMCEVWFCVHQLLAEMLFVCCF